MRPSLPAASKPTGTLLGREAGGRRKDPAPGKLPRRSLSWGCCAALKGARGFLDRPRDRQTANSPSAPGVLPLRVPARGPPAPGPGRSRSPCARAPGAPARCSRLRLGLWLPRSRAERGPTGTVGTAGGGAARGPDHPGGGRPWPARSARLGPAPPPSAPSRPAPPPPRSARAARLAALGGRGRGAEQGACLRGRSAPPLGPLRPRPSEARPVAVFPLVGPLSLPHLQRCALPTPAPRRPAAPGVPGPRRRPSQPSGVGPHSRHRL